jgi:hypothetical protein
MRAVGGHDWISLDVAHHALEHPDETLASGVHHAGILEDLHQLGGAGQGRLSLLQQAAHESADVASRPSRRLRCSGGFAGDGQNRAFTGIVHGLVEAIGALLDCRCDIECGRGEPFAQGIGEAQQEVREHHAGVASGAEHGRLGHGACGDRKRSVAERFESVGDGAKRQTEIGASVSVGYGKDVDPVYLLPSRGNPVGGSGKRPR